MSYTKIKDEIDRRIQRAEQRLNEAKITCTTLDGSEPNIICTRGTRYIVICDCIYDPPPNDFVKYAEANRIVIWCMDSIESQRIIEFVDLDADPDICPLLYDAIAEEVLTIGQPYSSTKWRLDNVYRR